VRVQRRGAERVLGRAKQLLGVTCGEHDALGRDRAVAPHEGQLGAVEPVRHLGMRLVILAAKPDHQPRMRDDAQPRVVAVAAHNPAVVAADALVGEALRRQAGFVAEDG